MQNHLSPAHAFTHPTPSTWMFPVFPRELSAVRADAWSLTFPRTLLLLSAAQNLPRSTLGKAVGFQSARTGAFHLRGCS